MRLYRIVPFLSVAVSMLPAATPITPDSSTVILDHFDGSTLGTPFGNPAYVSGPSGLNQAVSLDTGKYVQYPIPPTLESQGTIEMWLRPRSYDSGIMNFNWNNTTSYPPAGHVLHLTLNAEGKVSIGGWASNSACMYNLTSGASLPMGQWSHVALSWASSVAKILCEWCGKRLIESMLATLGPSLGISRLLGSGGPGRCRRITDLEHSTH